jgi:segregation and condensation protein B
MERELLDNIVLALLFASDEPLASKRISMVLDEIPLGEIRESVGRLETRFAGEDSAIRIEQVAGGYQLCTSPRYSDFVARLYRGRRKQRLSKAAMETLAIIAYRQPVTRADIESVRGVACGGVITTLMERSLIRIEGKARVLGSPFLYGTTQEFLEYLGLNSLKDLPSMEDLEALLEREAASEPADEPGEPRAAAGANESPADLPDEGENYGDEEEAKRESANSWAGAGDAAESAEEERGAGGEAGNTIARDDPRD